MSSRIRSSASRPTTSSAENQTVTRYLTESAGCSATLLVLTAFVILLIVLPAFRKTREEAFQE